VAGVCAVVPFDLTQLRAMQMILISRDIDGSGSAAERSSA